MTKAEVELIVKRYPQISAAVKADLPVAGFYKGNRKHSIDITYEVKSIIEIVDLIYEYADPPWIKTMIKGIMGGDSDIRIISEIHYSKSAFYNKKRLFIHKVYACCASRNIVSFEEILKEKLVK